MQEIGEQLDNAILAYTILLQLMHCGIASCVLHIACCMLRWCKIPLRRKVLNCWTTPTLTDQVIIIPGYTIGLCHKYPKIHKNFDFQHHYSWVACDIFHHKENLRAQNCILGTSGEKVLLCTHAKIKTSYSRAFTAVVFRSGCVNLKVPRNTSILYPCRSVGDCWSLISIVGFFRHLLKRREGKIIEMRFSLFRKYSLIYRPF